jgi:hypothetical protein
MHNFETPHLPRVKFWRGRMTKDKTVKALFDAGMLEREDEEDYLTPDGLREAGRGAV